MNLDTLVRRLIREELISAGLIPPASAPAGPLPPLAALVTGWAALCRAARTDALTAHDVLRRLYPVPTTPEPDGWHDLREAIEAYVPPQEPGAAPCSARFGEAVRRRVKGCPVRLGEGGELVRLAPWRMADGRPSKSGGRARWCVETVPAYEPAAREAALVDRLSAEHAGN